LCHRVLPTCLAEGLILLLSHYISNYLSTALELIIQRRISDEMTCSAPEDVPAPSSTAINDEEALLARLQSQFGDMDVSSFLSGSSQPGNGSEAGEGGCNDDDSESSLEEPSPEELRAWQESQFQKGRMSIEAKDIINVARDVNVHKSALQRRREVKSKFAFERTLIREHETSEEADEWEHVSSAPNLDEESIFFPASIDDDAVELAGGVHPLLSMLAEKGDIELLGTKWKRLYSSSDGDGLSFRNMWDKLRGYDGPTLMLYGGVPSSTRCIGGDDKRNKQRVSFGFVTTDSWIESTDYFGCDDDCFLFSLDYDTYDVKIFRPKSRSMTADPRAAPTTRQLKHHMYCHPSKFSRANERARNMPGSTDGSLHGIGIGGTPSQPRVHISESLEDCRALTYDNIFEDGDILTGKGMESLYYFDVDSIEIWGVGGEEWIADALKAQAKARAVHRASLEQARKVDKRQFLEDFENSLAWRSGNRPGVFGHRDLVDEREV